MIKNSDAFQNAGSNSKMNISSFSYSMREKANTFINVKGIMVTLTDPVKSLKLNLITFVIRHLLIDMEVRNFTFHETIAINIAP